MDRKARLHEIIKDLKSLNYVNDANDIAKKANQRIAQFFVGYSGPVMTGLSFTGPSCLCVQSQYYKLGCTDSRDLIARNMPFLGAPSIAPGRAGWIYTTGCGPNCCPNIAKVSTLQASFPNVQTLYQKLTIGKGLTYSDDQCWRIAGRMEGRTGKWAVVEIRYLGIPCGGYAHTGPVAMTGPAYNPSSPFGNRPG